AGIATLKVLQDNNGWQRLEELGAYFESKVAPLLATKGWSMVREGSIFWFSLQEGEAPRSAAAIDSAGAERYRPLFHGLFSRGVNMAPSAYEVGFVSLAHTEEDIDFFAEQLREVLATL
ncbi:MAG: glutamate-1-semialdehyde 2,1-aminomutase, partial [Planctomycetota bacterium]